MDSYTKGRRRVAGGGERRISACRTGSRSRLAKRLATGCAKPLSGASTARPGGLPTRRHDPSVALGFPCGSAAETENKMTTEQRLSRAKAGVTARLARLVVRGQLGNARETELARLT